MIRKFELWLLRLFLPRMNAVRALHAARGVLRLTDPHDRTTIQVHEIREGLGCWLVNITQVDSRPYPTMYVQYEISVNNDGLIDEIREVKEKK